MQLQGIKQKIQRIQRQEVFLIGVVLFSLFLLAGCTTKKAVDEYSISNEEFFQGTSSLEMEFQRGTPPEKAFEDSLVDVVLDVKNTGAYLLNGFVTLIFEKDFVCIADDNGECVADMYQPSVARQVQAQIQEKQKRIVELYQQIDDIHAGRNSGDANALEAQAVQLRSEVAALKKSVSSTNPDKTKWLNLEGKGIFTPEGESNVLVYHLKTKALPSLKTQQETQLIAASCYAYATTLNDQVCIDTNINKLKVFQGSCQQQDLTSSGQGAPLSIDRVAVSMMQQNAEYMRPVFEIHVRNAGDGKVINKERIEQACTSQGLEKRDYNMVFLNSFVLSNAAYSYQFNGYDEKTGKEAVDGNDRDAFDCYPNPLILKEGEDNYFRCALKHDLMEDAFKAAQASYQTPLHIDLSYGYQFSRSTTMMIEKEVRY